MSSHDEPSNLKELYQTALSLQSQLDTLARSSSEYTSTLQTALSHLQQCRHLAHSLSLFSPNESLDELSTSSLAYLAFDYHIATLLPLVPTETSTSNSNSSITAQRKSTISQTQESYSSFLSQLEDYTLLSPLNKKLFATWSADRNAFSLQSHTDPAQRREAKIARFRQEKDLLAQLGSLEAQSKNIQVDEDVLRKLRIAELRLFAHRSLQALDLLAQEMDVLARAPSVEEELHMRQEQDIRERGRGDGRDGYDGRVGPSRRQLGANGSWPILSPGGKPLQPFTLLDRRSEVKAGVFRSGHRLPTMSIDEYLDAERARGGIIEGGGEREEVVPDEDDLEAADRETLKKREWDEFVEANPKGSGNTLNRG